MSTPKGRQVYPRTEYRTDCGTSAWDLDEDWGPITCQKCLRLATRPRA